MTIAIVMGLGIPAWAQSTTDENRTGDSPAVQERRQERGAGREIGGGAADIGKGAAKGAGNLAKGTGKGAVDLVTLHPINAAASVGTGAVAAGKDVGVGTVKGTGRIAKGAAKALRKLF